MRSPPLERRRRCRRRGSPLPLALLLAALAAACDPGDPGDAGDSPAARAEPHVTVELTRVEPRPLSDVVALTGQLEAEHAVVLRSEVQGVIASIGFQEGQEVEAGDVLFRLRDDEQRARVHEAQAGVRLAEDTFERTQQLASRDVSSLARQTQAAGELDEARARLELARVELERTSIRAPFDGVVGLRLVSPGDRVEPEDGLVEIYAIDRLQLLFTVQEIGVPLARVGIPVAARVAAWPGESFPGEVFFVSPSLDPAARRLVLKAWIDNPDHRLKPGMFANVDVEIARKEAALVVPEAAVVYDRHGVYLWKLGPEQRAEKVPVEIGLRQSGTVEILEGIEAGDVVVSAGIHKVKAGSLLREAREAPPPAAQAAEGVPAPAPATGESS